MQKANKNNIICFFNVVEMCKKRFLGYYKRTIEKQLYS